jgi:hypothetical protein
MRCVLPAVILLFVLSPACVLAQTPEWPPVGELVGGEPLDVALQDGIAYVAIEWGMMAIDVSVPESPSLLGYWLIPSTDTNSPYLGPDIAVSGAQAYLVHERTGLWIIDIADPSDPHLVAFLDALGTPRDVAVSGTYAFVAELADSGERCLRVIDVSDPTDPFELARCPLRDAPNAVAVKDGYAYVTAQNDPELSVIDISDPGHPLMVSESPLGNGYDLAVGDSHVYIADRRQFRVIDISDPASPFLTAELAYPVEHFPHGVSVSGSYAYVADKYAAGLRVLDIADPANPTEVGFLETSGRAFAVTVSADYAYVAAERGGLVVADISDPENPAQAGIWSVPRDVGGLTVSDGTAFLAAGAAGLALVDVTDMQNPVELISVESPGDAEDVVVRDGYAYVADGEAGLTIVDVTQPTSPAVVGQWGTPDEAYDVAVSGDHAYVADKYTGLWVLGVVDPTDPTWTGLWAAPTQTSRVAVSGSYAYVAAGELWILDISDPAVPAALSYFPFWTKDVAVAGDLAYAGGPDGLSIADVSSPMEPFEVGALETHFSVYDVAVLGTTAYLGGYDGEFSVVDVSDPGQPWEVAHWDSPGHDGGLALSGGYVYQGAREWGLLIFPARATFGDVANDDWAFEHVEACVGSGIADGYPDGLYHCEVAVTRDQMAAYVSRALAGGEANVPEAGPDPTFPDVAEDHWAYGYVEYAAQEQVVQGFSDGLYRPDLELDRGQMAVYIARSIAGSDDAVPTPTGPPCFEDVPDTFWSYRHVEHCVSQGVVAGYEDGLYHPELTVTRDQMAVYVSRAFGM